MLRSATENYGDGLGVGALLNKGHLVVADLSLLDQSGLAQVVFGQFVNAGDNSCASSTGELLHVALLYAAYSVDSCLCQEVLGQVVNAFLDE